MSVMVIGNELYSKSVLLKKYVGLCSVAFFFKRRALLRHIDEIEQLIHTLRQALTVEHYSQKYYDTTAYMEQRLDQCRQLIANGRRDSRRTADKYLMNFHNLSRPFLSTNDPARISPEEAESYSSL